MSIAALIRSMAVAGAPAEAIALAVEAIEAADARLETARAAARERKARQRAKERDSHGTVTGQVGDSHAPSSPETKISPRPPIKTQPLSNTPSPPKGGSVPTISFAKPNGFARFWEAYPRKIGKGAAEKAYAKALLRIDGPDPPGQMLLALERVKPTWREPEFTPHASTWLNESRWEDEPETNVRALSHERPNDKLEQHNANLSRAFRGADLAAVVRAGR